MNSKALKTYNRTNNIEAIFSDRVSLNNSIERKEKEYEKNRKSLQSSTIQDKNMLKQANKHAFDMNVMKNFPNG